MKSILFIFTLISLISFCFWGGVRIHSAINFNQNCGGYLKRAANANTIELATKELSRAVKYIDNNELDSGYTSVLWKTPDEDIGFWRDNIVSALAELKTVKSETSSLEKSNILLKLRESLLDNKGDSGEQLNVPDGISVYPNNVRFFVWGWFSFGICAITLFLASIHNDYRF